MGKIICRRAVVVCLEDEPRALSRTIEAAPWRLFVQGLWAGEYGV